MPVIHHQPVCFCMPACALSLILQKTWFLGVVNPMQHAFLRMHCRPYQMASLAPLMPLACQPDPIHNLQTNPWAQKPPDLLSPLQQSPCGPLAGMEGPQPQSQTGFCCALYSPRVSVPIGLQQASHGSNSQQQAACLKLQPALYTISPTLQLLILEATYQQYLQERVISQK